MDAYLVFAIQIFLGVSSMVYIYTHHRDDVHLRYTEIQVYIWSGFFLCLGVIPWIYSFLYEFNSLVGYSILTVSIIGYIASTWNREQLVEKVAESETQFKKYRFVLPKGPYSDNLRDWFKFVVDPNKYVVEMHTQDGNLSTCRKYCLKVEGNKPMNQLETKSLHHGCMGCDSASTEIFVVDRCWNNPYETKVKPAFLCKGCYIDLTEKISEEVPGFESPTERLVASNL